VSIRQAFRGPLSGMALSLVAVIAIAACGSSSSATTTAKTLTAVLVAIQPVNDKGVMQDFTAGFNKAAIDNHYTAHKLIVLSDPATYESTLTTVAAQFQLVITTFPPMITPVSNVAPKFPNVHFVLLDAQIPAPLPNVQTMFFKENESSYLAGIVAGAMTKTNKVGFLGALDQDVINRYLVGFYEGAHHANPNVKVSWAYVNALEDPALGKQFALTMYSQNVDIIHAATAGTEVGVYQASEQAQKFLIGADVDIAPLDPMYGLTAAGPDFEAAGELAMRLEAEGKFQAGRQQFGLKDGAVRLLPYNGTLVPQSVQDQVATAKAAIIAGTITVDDDTKLKSLTNGS